MKYLLFNSDGFAQQGFDSRVNINIDPYAVAVSDEVFTGFLNDRDGVYVLNSSTGVVSKQLYAPEVINYTAIKNRQKQLIDASRITAENTEFIFAHNSINWDGGLESRNRLDSTLDAVVPSGTLPEGFYWTDGDNVQHHDITIAQLQALRAAMAQQIFMRGLQIHFTKGALIAAIDAAADDVAAITAIVWPS